GTEPGRTSAGRTTSATARLGLVPEVFSPAAGGATTVAVLLVRVCVRRLHVGICAVRGAPVHLARSCLRGERSRICVRLRWHAGHYSARRADRAAGQVAGRTTTGGHRFHRRA